MAGDVKSGEVKYSKLDLFTLAELVGFNDSEQPGTGDVSCNKFSNPECMSSGN